MAVKNTVSMQDIADQLGVSKVTVSKALNGKEGVGEEMKAKSFCAWQSIMAICFPTMDSARRKKSA